MQQARQVALSVGPAGGSPTGSPAGHVIIVAPIATVTSWTMFFLYISMKYDIDLQ